SVVLPNSLQPKPLQPWRPCGTPVEINNQRKKTTIRHFNFLNDREEIYDSKDFGRTELAAGHAGDASIILNFIEAIAENNPALLLADPEVSLESHLMAFAAERSRTNGKAEELCLDLI
ncbi:MAG: hypothetical protein WCL16_12465, partial [bacterium]